MQPAAGGTPCPGSINYPRTRVRKNLLSLPKFSISRTKSVSHERWHFFLKRACRGNDCNRLGNSLCWLVPPTRRSCA